MSIQPYLKVLCLISLLTGCRPKQVSEPPSDNFNSKGFSQNKLTEMENSILRGEYPNIHSVLISKDEDLIYEHYFPGKDELWGNNLGVIDHHRDSLHDVRSVSKSIVSACIGIAIDQGRIKDVHQSIFDFFPEYAEYNTGKKSKLTIHHFLTMTTGFEWNEDVPYDDPLNSEIQMTGSSDPIKYVFSQPLVNEPGISWKYNGGTTQVLAELIERTSGDQIDEFARKYLFRPLGIDKFYWTKFPELDKPAAASGLRLTSEDLMKFGRLYLNMGVWGGETVISENWIKKSTKAHIRFGRNDVGYGYQFWILKGETIHENLDYPIVAAFGNGDQRIYIDYQKNMIVVTTAGNYNKWTIKKDSEALLTNFVYPALKN